MTVGVCRSVCTHRIDHFLTDLEMVLADSWTYRSVDFFVSEVANCVFEDACGHWPPAAVQGGEPML